MVKIMDAKNEKLLDILKQWQKLEDAAVHTTTEIIRKADNPFPGPFEAVADGKQLIKVWPKPAAK